MGMHHLTGQSIDAIPHVYQSIAEIITTPLGGRVMRRDFGSRIPFWVDQTMNNTFIMNTYAEVSRAVGKWEPRVTLSRVYVDAIEHEKGFLQLMIEGDIHLNRLTTTDYTRVSSRETIDFSVPVLASGQVSSVGYSGRGLLVKPVSETVTPFAGADYLRLSLSQSPSDDMPVRVLCNGQVLNLESYQVTDLDVIIPELLDASLHNFEVDYFVEVNQ